MLDFKNATLYSTQMPRITERQREVYNWVVDFYEEHGVPPTLEEVCQGFGWASPNAARTHLQVIAAKGFLEKTKRGYIPA